LAIPRERKSASVESTWDFYFRRFSGIFFSEFSIRVEKKFGMCQKNLISQQVPELFSGMIKNCIGNNSEISGIIFFRSFLEKPFKSCPEKKEASRPC
jgi:hypothetical protein